MIFKHGKNKKPACERTFNPSWWMKMERIQPKREFKSEDERKAVELAGKLRKLYPVIVVVYLLIAIVGVYVGMHPWVAVGIAMVVTLTPVFTVGAKIDRLLGIKTFGVRKDVPWIELAGMLLLGITDLAIFVFAIYANSLTIRLFLVIVGILCFLGMVVPQGDRISRITRKQDRRKAPPEKREAFDKVYETLKK
jgi:hypothetical protein